MILHNAAVVIAALVLTFTNRVANAARFVRYFPPVDFIPRIDF